jgi:membrane-bound metal-dependent hydrolase YbcI (DUF457 family)
MFNTTHTFVGVAIARAGADKWSRKAIATAVIASNFPDIDSIAGFWGTASYLEHHRGITHSFVGVPIFALVLAAAMRLFSEKFWETYAIALIAMATHPALDYLNSYGTRPLLPFSGNWYYGDILFIIDPYLDIALALGLTASWVWPHRRQYAIWITMALALSYIAVRVELRNTVLSEVRQLTATREAERFAVLPNINPLRWEVIAESQSHVMRFDWDTRTHARVDTATRMDIAPPSAIIERATTTRSAKAILRFARFPVTTIDRFPSAYRVTFMDFRFYRESTSTALATEVTLDESMNVMNEQISFVRKIN